ncbi:MAG: hypothetical protein K9M75_08655 [Phycisphaerae bacterium]|nr:hypothetical protein [Phycisphaerae bacterium]
MYALNKKYWSHRGSGFEAHPSFQRMEHFLQSTRLWAIMGSMVIVALIIAVVAAMAMFALWMFNLDLSTFDPTPIIQ